MLVCVAGAELGRADVPEHRSNDHATIVGRHW
jgi:hypothetical protein